MTFYFITLKTLTHALTHSDRQSAGLPVTDFDGSVRRVRLVRGSALSAWLLRSVMYALRNAASSAGQHGEEELEPGHLASVPE